MNTTESVNLAPVQISVTTPLTQAFERVKRVLFQPFDLGKWFVIGFCAWLAQLGENGGGFNFNGGGNNHRGNQIGPEFGEAKAYVLSHLYWIIPVVIIFLLVAFALVLLITWLNSRGKFMLLHCVALNRAEVGVPWNKFARQADSLFWFRVVLGFIGFVLIAPVVVAGVLAGMAVFGHESISALAVAAFGGVVLLFLGLVLVFFLIRKLTMDFVVPIMFSRGSTCREGWGILRQLMAHHLGNFALYFLFQIVIHFVSGILVLGVMIFTCCVCCLMLMPYIGTVILLPLFVFHRAYSAYYLAQFGREFDVFSEEPSLG